MLSKKAQNITPSFTIGISNKVQQLKEKGIDIINLSIGEPDFKTPQKAKEFAIKAIDENKTKYDIVSGIKPLKEAIIEKLKKENKITYTPEEIVVSSGAKHSISNCLIALLNDSEEVLIPKPYWVSYPEMVKLVGAKPVFIETQKDNSFKVTKDEILNSLTDKTKLIILSNPSNPTGIVYDKKELEEIVDVCIEKNIYILADEIYEKICYSGDYTSVASISEKAKDITITVNGLSKSAAMTGWRIGYTASNSEIAKKMSSIQGHLVSHPCTIAQWAGVGALTECEDDMQEMVAIYKQRMQLVTSLLDEINELSYLKPQGAFYIFIDLSALKSKFKNEESLSLAFCNRLLEEGKVAAVPGIAFGLDHYMRISYACSDENIKEGVKRISNFIKSL